MSRNLTVNGTTFPYPDPGDEPGWGQPASDWAEEVTKVLNDLQGIDDIPETTANIANNIVVPLNVPGLIFNPTTVRSAIIDYSIYRTSGQTFLPANVNTGTEVITITGHTLVNGQGVMFSTTGTMPSGIVIGTVYYVINTAVNTFQISATVNGAPVNITSPGIGVHTASLELAEKGRLDIIYKNGAPTGTKWSIGRAFAGDDAGLVFTMTDSGQMQYTSSNMSGTVHTGTMVFEATVTQQ